MLLMYLIILGLLRQMWELKLVPTAGRSCLVCVTYLLFFHGVVSPANFSLLCVLIASSEFQKGRTSEAEHFLKHLSNVSQHLYDPCSCSCN
jgi:CHASE2 domain-containing sensor protein